MFIKNFSNEPPKNKFTKEECENFSKGVKFINLNRSKSSFVVTEVIQSDGDNWRRIHELDDPSNLEDSNLADEILELSILKKDLRNNKVKFLNIEE